MRLVGSVKNVDETEGIAIDLSLYFQILGASLGGTRFLGCFMINPLSPG